MTKCHTALAPVFGPLGSPEVHDGRGRGLQNTHCFLGVHPGVWQMECDWAAQDKQLAVGDDVQIDGLKVRYQICIAAGLGSHTAAAPPVLLAG